MTVVGEIVVKSYFFMLKAVSSVLLSRQMSRTPNLSVARDALAMASVVMVQESGRTLWASRGRGVA